MSAPKSPLELLDRYLQAVRFWLPKSKGQDDLLAELGEDIRSQIDEKEAALGRALDNNDVAEILKSCGSPMVVAGRLGPQLYLIGPTLFPVYAFVLKMVLLWILVPVFVFIVGPTYIATSHGDWPSAVLNTIGNLWNGLFVAAGVITLVFAILERTRAVANAQCKWDPLKLPPVRKEGRKPSFACALSELIFAVLGLMWLLLLPHYPFLILGPAAAILKASPMLHTFYLPIVLLSLLSIVKLAITLARPQWNWFPPAGELAQAGLTLVLLHFILNVAGHAPNGNWEPFVVLTDAARGSAKYVGVAAVVNASILLSLVCVWFGLCIALIIHLWHLMGVVLNRISSPQQPASLPMR